MPIRDELPPVKLYSDTTTLRMTDDAPVVEWIKDELYKLNHAIDANSAEFAAIDHGKTRNGRLWSAYKADASPFAQAYDAAAPESESLSLGPLLSTTWNPSPPRRGLPPVYFECLDRFPVLRARARAQVGEGSGVEIAAFEGGGVRAWAQREARLVARVPQAGSHVIAGAVILRPGDAVSVLVGSPPRLLGRVARSGPGEGPEFFRLRAPLPEGTSSVLLLSELPEREVRGGTPGVPAAFRIPLPLALWRDPAHKP